MQKVMCWQTSTGWVFYCGDKITRKHMIVTCRQQLGRSHGVSSMWHVGHEWRYQELGEHILLPVIVVRDPDMVAQLRLAYS